MPSATGRVFPFGASDPLACSSAADRFFYFFFFFCFFCFFFFVFWKEFPNLRCLVVCPFLSCCVPPELHLFSFEGDFIFLFLFFIFYFYFFLKEFPNLRCPLSPVLPRHVPPECNASFFFSPSRRVNFFFVCVAVLATSSRALSRSSRSYSRPVRVRKLSRPLFPMHGVSRSRWIDVVLPRSLRAGA